MSAQSVSVGRNREVDSADDHGLALVEEARDQEKEPLRVDSLSKRYGAIEAAVGVSFDVREGEIWTAWPFARGQDRTDFNACDARRRRFSWQVRAAESRPAKGYS
jgi:hypothetical protein